MTCFCLVTVDYSFSSLFNVYPASLSLLVLSQLPSYATPLIILVTCIRTPLSFMSFSTSIILSGNTTHDRGDNGSLQLLSIIV